MTQQKQAVSVGDPVALALYLELLSGGAAFAAQLKGLEEALAAQEAALQEADADADR